MWSGVSDHFNQSGGGEVGNGLGLALTNDKTVVCNPSTVSNVVR